MRLPSGQALVPLSYVSPRLPLTQEPYLVCSDVSDPRSTARVKCDTARLAARLVSLVFGEHSRGRDAANARRVVADKLNEPSVKYNAPSGPNFGLPISRKQRSF
jgi:hypothetical protein